MSRPDTAMLGQGPSTKNGLHELRAPWLFAGKLKHVETYRIAGTLKTYEMTIRKRAATDAGSS